MKLRLGKARSTTKRAPRPLWRRLLFWGAIGVGVLGVGAFAWDAWAISTAGDELKQQAAGASEAVAARDTATLLDNVEAMQVTSRRFASHTTGPHWWLAGQVPWVRDQTLPLQQAARSLTEVADGALGPLSQLPNLDSLSAPKVVDGRIDPLTLAPYREVLADAASVLGEQEQVLGALDLSHTLSAVKGPVETLHASVVDLSTLVGGASTAAEVLPGMLAAQGARTYLVMVQNNAEPRTTGGIPGAIIEIHVRDGRVTIGAYSSAADLSNADEGGVITEDERRIFTERMAIYPHDVNFTPEFPRSAQVLAEMWATKHGSLPDGVISVDPVVLGYMLASMEPVDIGGIEVTGPTLAQVMLEESYLRIEDPVEQDAFFALAASQLFAKILVSPDLIDGAQRGLGEGRVALWSADATEQEAIVGTTLGGDFIARAEALGIFMNDGSGSKIGYYVYPQYDVTSRVCSDGTLESQTITVTLEHTFEGDINALPEYISGGGFFVPLAEYHANVLIYPPTGMAVDSFTRDDVVSGINGESHHGRTVVSARTVLLPGQTSVLVFHLDRVAEGSVVGPIATTPGPRVGWGLPTSVTEVAEC